MLANGPTLPTMEDPSYTITSHDFGCDDSWDYENPGESIAKVINNRAANLGYGVGVVIGRTFLGGAAKSLSTYLSETRAAEFLLRVTKKLKQLVISDETVQPPAKQPEPKARPQLVKLEFHDSASNLNPKPLRDLNRELFNNTDSNDKYDEHYFFNVNWQQTCEILELVKGFGPIKIVSIKMHGNLNVLSHGNGNSVLTVSPEAILKNPIRCLKTLPPGVKIILNACSTALPNNVQSGADYVFPMNVQQFVAMTVPGSTVFAAPFDIGLDLVKIYDVNNTFKVKAYPAKEELFTLQNEINESTKQWNEGNILQRINALISGFLMNDKLYYAHQVKESQLEPMIKLKSEQLCTQVVPYFKMQKFCDSKNLKPAPEVIWDCKMRAGCEKLIRKKKGK